ncbi:ATP-dependent helicase [Candidatus Saccharibacteria bacterium]|nr:ATP-dependent helicase [Candidatus Saccharibacteria bacterium]
MQKRKRPNEVEGIKRWFETEVTYEGEPYTMDLEQAAAVMDAHKNTIVVARAGSGKTRTIVAKIIYLVAKCGVKPEEIMAFVFNSNAAAEINARLSKMLVKGEPVMNGEKIAQTFHAFSRHIIYNIYGGKERCGKILAGEKEDFVLAVVLAMLQSAKWRAKIERFVKGVAVLSKEEREDLNEEEIWHFAKMMVQFINRAQQKYLGGEERLRQYVEARKKDENADARELLFVELGMECYKRYHWYLLNEKVRGKLRLGLRDFGEYGTDFNLLVSWAGKIIKDGGAEVKKLLGGKKYILVDEYQDFSQLFLSVIMAIRGVAPRAKLFVVGDDWQAINRFAGSEVRYFKDFREFFPEGSVELEITTNYRCNYTVVDVARKFMKKAMKEKGGFRAFSRSAGEVMIVNPKKTEVGYAMVDYDTRVDAVSRLYQKIARWMVGRQPKKATVQYLKTVVEIVDENKGAREILVLHRNNETNIEGVKLERFGAGVRRAVVELGVMNGGDYDARVKFMTMHKSKGLEAEVVIILEVDAGVIPKTHPDTKLYGVFGETEDDVLDDQKRLFYVAMTRAKKRLYIIHDETNGGDDGFVKYLGKNISKRESL